MNKRIISLIVALCLICSMVPMSVSAVTVIVSGTCGKNLRWQLDEDGLLTISGTGAMTDFDFYDYEKDAAPWAAYSDQIETVFVSSGVTSIGEDAFWYCENLKSIEFSNSVVSLGNYSVYGCNMLTSVKIGNGLTAIGTAVFDCCDNLRVIEIDPQNPNYCTDESSVIYDVEKITVVRAPTGLSGQYIIPDTVTHIAADAFMHCEKLTEIVMQEGIVSIGSGAFVGCTSLTSVEIPNGVTQIESSTFSGCNFDTITIPNTVTAIRRYAFFLCENITDVFYSGTKSEWSAIEVYRDNECLIKAPFIHYSVVDSTDHWKTTEVSCGGYEYVCEKCNCGYMRDENGEQIVEHHVFNCEIATEAYLKKAATCTEPAIYYKSCTCGTRGEETFTSGSVDSYNHSFVNGECSRCDMKGGNCGDCLFWALDSTGVLSIWGTGEMENYASNYDAPWYEMRESVTTVIIDMGVTTVGSSAFSGCENLTYVSLPDGISRIGGTTFSGCSSLVHLEIPSSVTYIAFGAFNNCSSLKEIAIPTGVTYIGSGAFQGCSSLTGISIPYGITEIGANQFAGCSSLTDVSIPESVTEVKPGAFGSCTNLTAVTIPRSVTSIGTYAFDNCKNLLDVYYGGTVNEWSALGTNAPSAPFIHYNCAYTDDHWTTAIVDATCGEDGYYYESCNCGYSRIDTIIPATGEHDFVDGICTVCCAISYDFFGTDEEVTRGKMCYLIWAMNGCPKTNYTRTYVDLSKDDYYYTAIMWAVENGITIGITDSQFGPLNKCNRAQAVAFLFRDAGSPEPARTENIFDDVSENVYYYKAVLWAVEQKLQIANVCEDQFNPYATTTFGQILGNEVIHFEEAIAATSATCTESGLTGGRKCAVCGEILVAQEVIPALGHTGEIVPAVSATCTENGLTEGKICSVCGEVLVAQEIIKAQGHNYQSVVTAPTCTKDGYTTYACSVCGDSYVADETKALGHTEEIISSVAPNCTESGLTEGKKCSICGEMLVEQEEISALGHGWDGTSCQYCDATRVNPFADVPEGSFYINPVLWAVENEITNGTSADSFNPNGQCQRAQVVTFLWRAFGCPEPTSSVNPFVDVKESDFFYKPVLWAVENGITNGIDSTHFGSFAYCNRAQVVTFLWRASGSPRPTTSKNPFTDVVKGSFFYDPVLWAVENGITNGIDATTFGVDGICNRAQVVTFLYRAFN